MFVCLTIMGNALGIAWEDVLFCPKKDLMEAEEITSWSCLTAYGFMILGRDSYTIAKPIAKRAMKPSQSWLHR